MGGIKDIALIDPDDIQSQGAQYLQPNISGITLKPGKVMYLFQQARLTGRFQYQTNTDASAGDYVTCELNAQVRGVALDRDWIVQKFMNRRIHAVVTYLNGTQRYVKNLRFRATHDSGARKQDRVSYSFTATSRLLLPPPLIAAPLNLPYVCTGAGDSGPCDCTETTMIEISTSAPSTSYTVPQGRLVTAIQVKSNAGQTVNVGLTDGGGEIAQDIPLAANQDMLTGNNALYADVTKTIYFTGLQGNNTIRIWLLHDA